MAAKAKQEVAPAEELKSNLPAEFMQMIEADSGAGVENLSMDDVGVPYLYILQTNSPQVNEDHDMYVRDAKAGMFYNNLSAEVFNGREEGIVVIPCGYERKLVEWKDRDEGGGYVADHTLESGVLDETTLDERKRPRLANGNLIVETAYHYVFMLNPHTEAWEEIIIPMKSTALKKSRRWNKALMSTIIPGSNLQAPRWLYPYRLKTIKEQKDNNTWSNFDITKIDKPVTVEQYKQAKAFAKQFASGQVVKAKEADVGGGPVIDGETVSKVDSLKDDIPF